MKNMNFDDESSQMLFWEKYFKEFASYKCYSGPFSELDLGYIETSHFSLKLPSSSRVSHSCPVQQTFRQEAAILLGRNDETHRMWLEKIQKSVESAGSEDKNITSVLLSFKENKNYPDIQQSGLLMVGNIEDILQVLPHGLIPVDLKYVSRTFKTAFAKSRQVARS